MITPPQLPRWPWLDIRWITMGIVAIFVAGVLWGLFGPEPRIVVSRETTFITEPHAADGLPDYRAHALALERPAPDDNAAVPLFFAFWKTQVDAATVPRMLVALGLPAAVPMDSAFVDPRSVGESIGAVVGRARRPWKSDEDPALADWLRRYERGIDRFIEASRRPRYWFPGPTLLNSPPDLLFCASPRDMNLGVSATYVLASRAMWHLGEGRVREAWRDIAACHRLSRRLAPAQRSRLFFADVKAALFAAQMANDATRRLLGCAEVSTSEREAIRDELKALGPIAVQTGPFVMERLAAMDATVAMAAGRLPTGWRERFDILHGRDVSRRPPWLFVVGTSLDWNLVLRELNKAYDDLDAAAALPTPSQSTAALATLEASRSIRVAPAGPWQDAGTLFTLLVNRSERSVWAAHAIEAVLIPAMANHTTGMARATADFEALLQESTAGAAIDSRPPVK